MDSTNPSDNQFNTVVQEVWNDINHPQSAEGVWIIDRAQNRPEDFSRQAAQFQISVVPSVAFVRIDGRPDKGVVLVRIIGRATRQKVEQTYLDLLNGKFSNPTGSSPTGSSPIIEGDGQNGIIPGWFTGSGSTTLGVIAIIFLLSSISGND